MFLRYHQVKVMMVPQPDHGEDIQLEAGAVGPVPPGELALMVAEWVVLEQLIQLPALVYFTPVVVVDPVITGLHLG
jgi:hypothetical protein